MRAQIMKCCKLARYVKVERSKKGLGVGHTTGNITANYGKGISYLIGYVLF